MSNCFHVDGDSLDKIQYFNSTFWGQCFEIFSTFWDYLNVLRVFKRFESLSMFSLIFSLRFEILLKGVCPEIFDLQFFP